MDGTCKKLTSTDALQMKGETTLEHLYRPDKHLQRIRTDESFP